jgi:hypothetical protein
MTIHALFEKTLRMRYLFSGVCHEDIITGYPPDPQRRIAPVLETWSARPPAAGSGMTAAPFSEIKRSKVPVPG